MMNNRWIMVFDLETDAPNPQTCNAVELAAVPVNPRTLEIKAEQAFRATIKPDNIDKEEYFTKARQDTIAWHAKTRGVETEDIIKDWKSGQSEKVVWKNFCEYCAKYKVDKKPGQWYTEPIPAGYNIIGFDMPILQRMADKYGTKMPLSTVTKIDMMDILFMWFENLDEPNSMKLDTFRDFFGMKASSQAHEALSDTIDEAKLMVKFMKFHRKQASVSKFKGAFK
jgi:inhibitor of KinA sporulation pathway (predicted exonuclease)|tara:strand:+ start:14555 stop:15229 length:675 start_codon:yes stop_codon:yes gene_type:complete